MNLETYFRNGHMGINKDGVFILKPEDSPFRSIDIYNIKETYDIHDIGDIRLVADKSTGVERYALYSVSFVSDTELEFHQLTEDIYKGIRPIFELGNMTHRWTVKDEKGLTGVIDDDGNILLEPEFDAVSQVVDNMCLCVRIDDSEKVLVKRNTSPYTDNAEYDNIKVQVLLYNTNLNEILCDVTDILYDNTITNINDYREKPLITRIGNVLYMSYDNLGMIDLSHNGFNMKPVKILSACVLNLSNNTPTNRVLNAPKDFDIQCLNIILSGGLYDRHHYLLISDKGHLLSNIPFTRNAYKVDNYIILYNVGYYDIEQGELVTILQMVLNNGNDKNSKNYVCRPFIGKVCSIEIEQGSHYKDKHIVFLYNMYTHKSICIQGKFMEIIGNYTYAIFMENEETRLQIMYAYKNDMIIPVQVIPFKMTIKLSLYGYDKLWDVDTFIKDK